ncbi:MAG: hypothetical protein KDK38_05710, partial [Leptospiraceae bacterium]|nr:hypothetical protein [Leptospiraceae bacterium]
KSKEKENEDSLYRITDNCVIKKINAIYLTLPETGFGQNDRNKFTKRIIMKKIQISIFSFLFYSLFMSNIWAECDTKIFVNKAKAALSKNITAIESYHLNGRDGAKKVFKYSLIMSKNTIYTVALTSAKGLIYSLQDSRGKELVSNFKNGNYSQTAEYRAAATGTYSLVFTFDGKGGYCAGAALGMRR